MKKWIALLLVTCLAVAMLAGCGGGEAAATPAPQANEPAPPAGTAAPAPEATPPEESNVVSDTSWNDMTDEELYELAKQEGGEIVIYAITSRMPRTCEAFMEAYPGLTAISTDFDQNEAVSKIEIESNSGNVAADILQCKDSAGEIYYDFYPEGYLETYFPTDICSKIDPALMKYGMPFYAGLNFWYYNTEQFDAAPISNWWDIIEQDSSGNNKWNIVCQNLGGNDTTLAVFGTFILNNDKMEQAYMDKYGTPLEYTYDASVTPGVPENNAGYEFLYRFSQMKLTFISDGDDIVEAVHASTAPTLGLCSAGKITNRDDNGWNIAWVEELAPYTNVANCNYLYLTKGCDNPAGARLFIRFLMGGAEGGGAGFDPFTKEGNWSIRSDYENPNNPFPIDSAKHISPDIENMYPIFLDVHDFWEYWLNKNTKL